MSSTFSLADFQALTEAEFSVEKTREDLNAIADFYLNKEYQEEALLAIGKERKLPAEVLRAHKAFYVDFDETLNSLPEEYRSEALGLVKYKDVIYAGRFVYSVMDVKGNVMGFCGWDPGGEPKYLDSKNHGYKAKEATFYGMEKLPEYYRSSEPIYVVEGIVCCLYLRSKGLQAIALLGSSMTKYVVTILKRLEKRLVFIPDNDVIGKSVVDINCTKPAGEHFVKQVKRELPSARVIQSIIAKDVDDTRLFEDGKYEEDFLAELKIVARNPFYMFKTIRMR